jgi:cysteinyl-tRNA synthetase
VEKVVRSGIEPQSRTHITFTGPFDFTAENRLRVRALAGVLETRLRERLREDLGGTYSVSVNGGYDDVPEARYTFQIRFGSDPERADELREAVDRSMGAFTAAMNDDFNTREALAVLFDLGSAVNRHVDGADAFDYRGLRRAIETFERLGGGVLGFDFDGDATSDVSLADGLIELVLAVREREREAGQYDRADQLRAELEELGVTVEDTDDGVTYRY